MSEDRHLSRRRVLRVTLTAATLASSVLACAGAFNPDAEGRLFGVGLGSVLAASSVPFWGLLRRPLPLRLFAALIVCLLLALMALSAWACRASGTGQVHLYAHWYLAAFSLPGLAAVLWQHLRHEAETQAA